MFRDPMVNLYVSDVDVAAHFYQEMLGFAESFRTPAAGPPVHVELRLGAFTLGLGAVDAAQDMHGIEVTAHGLPRGEVVVWTDDADAAYADVVAKGARPLSPPHDFVSTLRAGWVADPDGNPVQIVARRSA